MKQLYTIKGTKPNQAKCTFYVLAVNRHEARKQAQNILPDKSIITLYPSKKWHTLVPVQPSATAKHVRNKESPKIPTRN